MVTCDKLLFWIGKFTKGLVAEEGLEPPTRGLWFRCSNQLSYSAIPRLWPVIKANSRAICTPPTPEAKYYWLLPMRVKLLSQNKEKKLPQSQLDSAPAARIPWLLSYESHSAATISQSHLTTPKHRIDEKKRPLWQYYWGGRHHP